MSRLHVILFTPRALLAELLAPALRRVPGVDRVAVASTGRDALRAARRRRVTLCVMDAANPAEDPFAVAARLRRADVRVVVLADSAPAGWIQRSLAAGASAYLGPRATLDDLRRALNAAASGQAYFTPCAAQMMTELASGVARAPTGRRLQVLRLLCDGLSSKDVARRLGLSPKTIDGYRAALMEMAGVRSASSLVRFACDERFVDVRPRTR